MSEILLQAIIEKLEALEIAVLKKNSANKDEVIQQDLLKEIKSFQSEFKQLPMQFETSFEKISTLLKSTAHLKFKSGKQTAEQIKHSHHLHKGIWIAIGLFILSLLFLYGWFNCINTKKSFEANDIKYRFLKVNGGTALLKLLFQTDSLYNLNKDSFTKQVFEKEKNLVEQAEEFRLADEKKKEARSSKTR